MTPFEYGLIFAAAERVVQTVIAHSFRFQPLVILEALVFEFPPFVAFAFIAGVGAEWISDTSHNHTAEIIWAGAVWCICLLLRNVLCTDLWWLKPSLLKQKIRLWQWSTIGIGVLSLGLALGLYLFWRQATGLSMKAAVSGIAISLILYTAALVYYCLGKLPWLQRKCTEYVADLLHLYCTKSPNGAERICRNPMPHKGQDSHFYLSKYLVAYREWTASQQCCCLEDRLVKSIANQFSLAERVIRDIVRQVTKAVASECELEYYVLTLIVATDQGYKRALDVVKKSDVSVFLPEFETMRLAVEGDGKLMEIKS